MLEQQQSLPFIAELANLDRKMKLKGRILRSFRNNILTDLGSESFKIVEMEKKQSDLISRNIFASGIKYLYLCNDFLEGT